MSHVYLYRVQVLPLTGDHLQFHTPTQISHMRAKRAPRSPLTSSCNFKKFAKNCSKLRIEEVDENCSKLQNCGGGLGPFLGGILPSFLGSIFDPFLVNFQSRICLFQRVSCPSKVVFGPFLDVFLTVHLTAIFISLGPPGARWVTNRSLLPAGCLSGGCRPG
jgi:hypothetical protein